MAMEIGAATRCLLHGLGFIYTLLRDSVTHKAR